MTWVMFWGEFLCLLFFLAKSRWARPPPTYAAVDPSDALAERTQTQPVSWRSSLVCFLPAMCDIFGTTLYA